MRREYAYCLGAFGIAILVVAVVHALVCIWLDRVAEGPSNPNQNAMLVGFLIELASWAVASGLVIFGAERLCTGLPRAWREWRLKD